jgi:hypothetical protein
MRTTRADHDVEWACWDWHDGEKSALWAVHFKKPFSARKLLAEVNDLLQKYPDCPLKERRQLDAIKSFAEREVAIEVAEKCIRQAAARAAKAGITRWEAEAIFDKAIKRECRI